MFRWLWSRRRRERPRSRSGLDGRPVSFDIRISISAADEEEFRRRYALYEQMVSRYNILVDEELDRQLSGRSPRDHDRSLYPCGTYLMGFTCPACEEKSRAERDDRDADA